MTIDQEWSLFILAELRGGHLLEVGGDLGDCPGEYGGRRRLLTAEQETALVNMVIANNAIRLSEIQTQIVEDPGSLPRD